jgi:tRNA(fMet)-specific endonuclease VapC
MSFLLDTCIISELASRQPHSKVVAWIDSLADDQVFISVVTIGEIKRGVDRLARSRKKRVLEDWLNHGILVRFQENILMLDTEVMLAWGSLTAELDKSGTPMPALDSLIAASARFHRLTLATRNTRDFSSAPISLFNPWQ